MISISDLDPKRGACSRLERLVLLPAAVGVISLLALGCAMVSQPQAIPATDVPAPERVRLPNGLTVILHEHRAADIVAVQLWVRAGARDEAEAENGVSHFVEHLLFKGTPTRGPGTIDRQIAELGGEINAATSHDFTYYHLVLPARHLDTALEIVADVAANAAFDPAEIERERLVILEEIRRQHDNPRASLWRSLAHTHYTRHPYRRPVLGTPETIRALDRERLLAYYRRYYVPNNMTLVLAGSLDRAAVLARVEQALAPLAPRPLPEARIAPEPPLAEIRRAREERPVRQAYLGMAWPGPVVPDEACYAMDLLASILGQGRSSRLNQELKERQGLVSRIGASFYAQREAGTITITAQADPARLGEVEHAVLREIDRIRRELVTPAELERALTAVESGYAFGHETAEGAARSWGHAETVWTLEHELRYLERLRRVTREEIQRAAERYLAPDRFTVAVLTPPAS